MDNNAKKSCIKRTELLPSLLQILKTNGQIVPADYQEIAKNLGLNATEAASMASFYADFNSALKSDDLCLLKPGNRKPGEERKLLDVAAPNATEYINLGGYAALDCALKAPEKIIEEIKLSELSGRGGGGFPVGKKWESAKKSAGDEKYVICNAGEGEPDTAKDMTLLEYCPCSVIEGMTICAVAVGAKKGFICIRSGYEKAVAAVESALESTRAKGYLGKGILGSTFNFDIEIVREAGAYVCGEETAMLEMLEGYRGVPRLKPPYPGTAGYLQKPTVINNAESFANIPLILKEGSEKYRSIGADLNSGTKLVTVSGCVKEPGVYEYPMGTSIRTIFIEAGGNPLKLAGFQIGGGGSGSIVNATMLDTPLDFYSCQSAGMPLGTGSIRFFETSAEALVLAEKTIDFMAEQSCGTCTPCREGFRQVQQILGRMFAHRGRNGDIENIVTLAKHLQGNARCALGQTGMNPLITAIKYFRPEFEALIWKGE